MGVTSMAKVVSRAEQLLAFFAALSGGIPDPAPTGEIGWLLVSVTVNGIQARAPRGCAQTK
jgi:hypothetical protein